MPIWTDAVTNAIQRHVARTGSALFTRKALIAAEGDAIEAETGTRGVTPTQTMGRVLQELREDKLVAFLEPGNYRWLGDVPDLEPTSPSKGVFVLPVDLDPVDRAERYRLHSTSLRAVKRMIGQWVVYQLPRPGNEGDYVAVARMEEIRPAIDRNNERVARLRGGSYLELGRAVPFRHEGVLVEQGLLAADGHLDRGRASRPVRPITNADFNRIVALGLVTEDDLLPRTDEEDDAAMPQALLEDQSAWEGPIDRTTMLASRKVRDRQFRKRVLDTYGETCALTGMKLINGGGRAETQAAHIMSVEAGGPDAVNNGIALSGTIHWMFDRGLISLSDAGDILLSCGINDRESVERLIFPDRKARLPKASAHRPNPRYLHWHRTECFHD